tara:strand:- start:317588 stop:318556 length:969 start_codon:yes stop_codon:yes gene_type:complete
MKIAILDDYQDSVRHLDCFSMLVDHEVKVFTHGARGLGQLAIRLAGFEILVLIGERTRLSQPLLEKLSTVKMIVQIGKAGSHIDQAALSAKKIAFIETGTDAHAKAELTWALIMAAMRKLPQYTDNLQCGLWQIASTSPAHNTLGRSLKGRTLGVWGYGQTGQLLAAYGKVFGMRVIVWGRDESRAVAARDGVHLAASREALFRESDVLSLHLPLHDDTRGIVNAADFACMKPDALFVNTACAELLQPDVLLNALQQGHPGQAALDVFESEPLASDSPLLQMQNVLVTPHIGNVEKDHYEMMFRGAFQEIVDFAAKRDVSLI